MTTTGTATTSHYDCTDPECEYLTKGAFGYNRPVQPVTCVQCDKRFVPPGFYITVPREGRRVARDPLCPMCADKDPVFVKWQSYIDEVLNDLRDGFRRATKDDPHGRHHLALMISSIVRHVDD